MPNGKINDAWSQMSTGGNDWGGGVENAYNRLEQGLKRTSGSPELDPNNFNLQGQDARRRSLLQQADYAAGRRAPQIGQSQFAGDQRSLVSMLQNQAAGRGPSAAGLMMKDALGRNVSSQQALLASGGPGGARQASQMAGQLGGSIANQVGQARVQEQLGAQGLLSQTLQGARGLDQARQGMMSDAELRSRGLNDQQIARMRQMELDNARIGLEGTMGLEAQRTARRGQDLGVPTMLEMGISGASGLLAARGGK